MKKVILLAILVVSVFSISCSKDDKGDDSAVSPEEYYFTAEVTLPNGSKKTFSQPNFPLSSFSVGYHGDGVTQLRFVNINSQSNDNEQELFALSATKLKRLKAEGKYKNAQSSDKGFFAGQYESKDGKTYQSVTGEVVITEFSEKIVVGTFSFVGVDTTDSGKEVNITGRFKVKVLQF